MAPDGRLLSPNSKWWISSITNHTAIYIRPSNFVEYAAECVCGAMQTCLHSEHSILFVNRIVINNNITEPFCMWCFAFNLSFPFNVETQLRPAVLNESAPNVMVSGLNCTSYSVQCSNLINIQCDIINMQSLSSHFTRTQLDEPSWSTACECGEAVIMWKNRWFCGIDHLNLH